MKLLYEWLNDYIDLSAISPNELAEKMSRTGIEVDSVTVPGREMKNIVVGKVVSVTPHPDSERLNIAMVDVHQTETLQIVCGAPNIAQGQTVIVALPGAIIAEDKEIKRGEIRGVASNGMICSLQELGIANALVPKEFEEGIYVFSDESIEIGSDALTALALDSAVVELDLTANRADALSVRGAVHEISAIYGLHHQLDPDDFSTGETDTIDGWISVAVEDSQVAPAYHIQIIENVTIKPSPIWMQRRLIASGIRPINNVVDVTNYVLIEYGQPLHAFDYHRLGSQNIFVRQAKNGETITTLDGVERHLENELVITNGTVPIALAGVMGGLDSEITEQTTTVALESALFDPKLIRQASQKHNLRSESSSRFEKGINKATIIQAAKRAATLIAELGEGNIVEGIASKQSILSVDEIEKTVSIRLERLNHVLGTTLTQADVTRIFAQLGFPIVQNETEFIVTIPARRWDITIEADLIEEIGRIYGYDKLPSTLPTMASTRGGLTDKQRFVRWTRSFLQGTGLSQAYTYALTTPEKATWFTIEDKASIHLDLPMSEERSTLRQSLVPSLLEALHYNSARFEKNVRLYEVGRVFAHTQQNNVEAYEETEVISAALTGNWQSASWQQSAQPIDFYVVKGLVEAYVASLGCKGEVRFEATQTIAQMHPGQTAFILYRNEVIGFVGKVHPQIAQSLDLNDTFVFEFKLAPLLAAFTSEQTIQAVPKFPGTSRDIALLVPTNVTNDQLVQCIQAHGGEYLTNVQLFDVYQGEHVASGFKSLAYTIQFINPQRTLQDEEVKQAMDQIVDALQKIDQLVIR